MTDTTAELLAERQKTHGDFTDHAHITQGLKYAMMSHARYNQLPRIHKEALEMIVHKIGRIIAGNHSHNDHWDDIAGYARLVSERLGKP